MSLIVAEYKDRIATAKTPAHCAGCGGWVTGASRCLVCELGDAGMREVADPKECWQLSAFLEAHLLLKLSQIDRRRKQSMSYPAIPLSESRESPIVFAAAD